MLATLTLFAAISGCQPTAGGSTASTPEQIINIDETSALDVGNGFLRLVAAEMSAIQRRDFGVAEAYRKRQVALAASDELLALVAKEPKYKIAVGDDIVPGFVRIWGAVVSYYVEGAEYEKSHLRPGTSDKLATVLTPARGAADHTILATRLIRGADQHWRVSSVSFETEAPTTSSAPAAPQ